MNQGDVFFGLAYVCYAQKGVEDKFVFFFFFLNIYS